MLGDLPIELEHHGGGRSFPDFPPLFPDVHSFFFDSCGSLQAVAVAVEEMGEAGGQEGGEGFDIELG